MRRVACRIRVASLARTKWHGSDDRAALRHYVHHTAALAQVPSDHDATFSVVEEQWREQNAELMRRVSALPARSDDGGGPMGI